MEIKKDTKVKVPYRPDLGTGAVLQVAEAHGGEYYDGGHQSLANNHKFWNQPIEHGKEPTFFWGSNNCQGLNTTGVFVLTKRTGVKEVWKMP